MDVFVAFHEELMFLTSLHRPQVNFVPDFSHVSVEKRRRAVCLGYSWVRITQSYCWCKSRHYWKVTFTNMKRSKIIQIWFFHIHHPQPHCPSFFSPWRTGYQEKPHTDRKELSYLRELYWWTLRAPQWVGWGGQVFRAGPGCRGGITSKAAGQHLLSFRLLPCQVPSRKQGHSVLYQRVGYAKGGSKPSLVSWWGQTAVWLLSCKQTWVWLPAEAGGL